MAKYSFRDLTMWQKSQQLVVEIIALTRTLPTDRTTAILVQQVVRSSTAISANIAEGHGRFAAGAYRNHLSIARGSAAETISWLDTLRRINLLGEDAERQLIGLCDEVMSMVSAKMIDLDKQTGNAREFREEREVYDSTSE